MSRGFRICVENMGIESLRPSYGRPKLTPISSIAEVVDFSFNQFHRQFCQITLHFVNLSLSFSRWLIFRLISFTASFCQMTLNFVNFSPPFRCSQSVEMQSHLAKMAVELIKGKITQFRNTQNKVKPLYVWAPKAPNWTKMTVKTGGETQNYLLCLRTPRAALKPS